MHFWYKFFTYLLYPFAPIYLFFRKLKKKEHSVRYKEKLSQINQSRGNGFLIWFHVASVGEGMSILPLIENLEQEKKIEKILITSITLSSGEVLKKRLAQNKKVVHQFLPLDVPIFVNKFLAHWSPNLSIFVDSEIWPNLISKIKAKNIPLLLINGRITKKSFSKWKFVNNYSKKIFGKFDLCIAANKKSENYLKILGAINIKNYGNLKFANTKFNSNKQLDSNFLSKIKDRKIWCAASTHSLEETFCGKAHLNLKKTYKDILTIIIPRHIDRSKVINQQLSKMGLKVAFYSNLNQVSSDTDIILVDFYGETSKFYGISRCVFLGGSLIEHGGQNPIEPSRLDCKIFHGPNISNFDEIYDYLKSLGVANQVNSVEELNQSLVEEFSSEKFNNSQIIKKINDYGLDILNNVIKEIKIYINT